MPVTIMPESSATHPLTCQELVELVTDYFENALPASEHLRVMQHLQECHGCEEYVQQMRLTIQTLGALHQDDLSADAQAKLLDVFRDWRIT